MNLIQKLASIRKELTSIPKQGHNKFHNYDYLRAEDIAGEMGDRLAVMNVIVGRRNLQFTQNLVETKERVDVHVIVTLDYVFIDGDTNVGLEYDSLTVASIGEGRDSGDKACAKALTNALKYALTQPLMMRIGDDPEADAPHDADKGKPAQVKEPGFKEPIHQGSNGILASEPQRKLLLKFAKSALGEKEGAAWLKNRMKELGITGPENFQQHNWQSLLNELNQKRAGQENQEPVEEAEIEF